MKPQCPGYRYTLVQTRYDWLESGPTLGQLMGSFQHLHEEGVDRGVANQLEEEQVLQAFQPDGAQRWQSEEEFGEPSAQGQKTHLVLIQCCV